MKKNTQRQKLTPQKRAFVDEYIINHRNGQAAAVAAGYSARTARNQASRLLHEECVREYLEKRVSELQIRTGITQDRVLQELWDIATADPNDLIEYRRVNCRYCWGDNHKYQMTPNEIEEQQFAYEMACRKANEDGRPEPVFNPRGGGGYNGMRAPNPNCPECFGAGIGFEFVKDTRLLSPAVKALYAGVERTKEGVKVKMYSKIQALELIGRSLGLWNDKLKVQGDKENPLKMLYEHIKGNRIGVVYKNTTGHTIDHNAFHDEDDDDDD